MISIFILNTRYKYGIQFRKSKLYICVVLKAALKYIKTQWHFTHKIQAMLDNLVCRDVYVCKGFSTVPPPPSDGRRTN